MNIAFWFVFWCCTLRRLGQLGVGVGQSAVERAHSQFEGLHEECTGTALAAVSIVLEQLVCALRCGFKDAQRLRNPQLSASGSMSKEEQRPPPSLQSLLPCDDEITATQVCCRCARLPAQLQLVTPCSQWLSRFCLWRNGCC